MQERIGFVVPDARLEGVTRPRSSRMARLTIGGFPLNGISRKGCRSAGCIVRQVNVSMS
jgi:hypothetical protein